MSKMNIRQHLISMVDSLNSINSSPVVTLVVGPEARLFACHECILAQSPYFASLCRDQYVDATTKRIDLIEEVPEVLSSVLEYLYKGDYSPRLAYNKKQGSWELEDDGGATKQEFTVFHATSGSYILKVSLTSSQAPVTSSLPSQTTTVLALLDIVLHLTHLGYRYLLLCRPLRP